MDCTEEKTIYQTACEYAEQGLRILPCGADKLPRIKGWPDLATTDRDQIRKWWAKWRGANVGIATGEGSGVLVVDVDIKGGGNGFVELEAFLGYPVEDLEAPRYRTPSGGAQLWFKYPTGNDRGIATKAHIGGLSIDTRANGGLCLAPPSATADGRYEWIVEPEEFDNLPECPGDLLDLLREPGRAKSGGNGKVISDIADAEGHTLETHPGAGSGLRNGLLVVLVGKWLSNNPGASWEQLEPLVVGWNNRCRPPKPDEQALKPARYLWSKEQKAPKLRLDNLAPAGGGKSFDPPAQEEASGPRRLLTTPASKVVVTPTVWLWENHFEAGAINILSGVEGVGKSCIAVNIAARVSRGDDWPDGSPCRRGTVFYWSVEENRSTVAARLCAAGADMDAVTIPHGVGTTEENAETPDLKEDFSLLVQDWQDNSYDLIVIDTFQASCMSIEHKDSNQQKKVLSVLKEFAECTGATFLLAEHHRRGGQGSMIHRTLGPGLTRQARSSWNALEGADGNRFFIASKINNGDKNRPGNNWIYATVGKQIPGQEGEVPAIDWMEPTDMRDEDYVSAEGNGGDVSLGRPADEFEKAVAWLRAALEDPVPAKEMEAGWKSEMLKSRTVNRAKEHLLIKSQKIDNVWHWMPPPKLVTEIPSEE